jgi:hypothetical protein
MQRMREAEAEADAIRDRVKRGETVVFVSCELKLRAELIHCPTWRGAVLAAIPAIYGDSTFWPPIYLPVWPTSASSIQQHKSIPDNPCVRTPTTVFSSMPLVSYNMIPYFSLATSEHDLAANPRHMHTETYSDFGNMNPIA